MNDSFDKFVLFFKKLTPYVYVGGFDFTEGEYSPP